MISKKSTITLAALALSIGLLFAITDSRAGSSSIAWQDVVKFFAACDYEEECMQKKFNERSIEEKEADRLAVMMIQGCMNIGGRAAGLPGVSGEAGSKTRE